MDSRPTNKLIHVNSFISNLIHIEAENLPKFINHFQLS